MTTNGNGNGIIAVPGLVTDVAGAIVYWRLADTTHTESLRASLAAAGVKDDHLPAFTSADAALRRSVYQQKAPHRLVRNVAGAWHVVNESVSNDRPEYTPDLRVEMSDSKGWLTFDPPARTSVVEDIEEKFRTALDHISQHEVSAWMVKQAYRLGCVALRDTGGIYFIPKHALPEWRTLVEAVRSATKHTVFEIPALKSDEAVAAILDAVRAEAEQAATALMEELTEGKLGARGLRSRQETCEAVIAKLTTYEKLLGASMDDIKAKVETLQGEVVAAVMIAEASETASR